MTPCANSSSAVALPLPALGAGAACGVGPAPDQDRLGWIIDTPGLRSFGLAHVAPDRVIAAFGEFADALADCEPGCTHIDADCTLDDWVAAHGGGPAAARLDSLRRLLRSREGLEPADE